MPKSPLIPIIISGLIFLNFTWTNKKIAKIEIGKNLNKSNRFPLILNKSISKSVRTITELMAPSIKPPVAGRIVKNISFTIFEFLNFANKPQTNELVSKKFGDVKKISLSERTK